MTVTTRWEKVCAHDGEFDAYCAIPENGRGPGILVFQEIFGVNEKRRTRHGPGRTRS